MIVLKKLEKDYDPTNRSGAIQMMEEAQSNNWLVTGLIYIDTSKPALTEMFNLVETPLNRLTESDLRPAPPTLEKINSMMF
jgi:2-oxoglutarate ferredoxin oxidoreductase subunit beta